MYLEHFGLVCKPFSLIPDPAFLHLSKKHQMALTMLEYGISEQTGITLITGEIGSGKTTLVRHILKQLDHNRLTVGLINNSHESLGELTQWIALAFDLEDIESSKIDLFKRIQAFVIQQYALGKRVLLIVDEAQNLGQQALEELRLFTNINSDDDHLLQVVLVGQPELKSILAMPSLSQLAQRVSVEYHLKALDWEESKQYIRHRLRISGAQNTLFDNAALAAIYYNSGGIPRLINTLCDYALVYAFAADKKSIDLDLVLESLDGRQIGGINRTTEPNFEAQALRKKIKASRGLDIARGPREEIQKIKQAKKK